MKLKCNVIDVGARYGLHPTWKELCDIANFHLFEMDFKEALRLRKKYADNRNIEVYSQGLYSSDGKVNFKQRAHNGLSSILSNDSALRKKKMFMVNEADIVSEKKVAVKTIDSIFHNKDIHFLKIDTEGTELEVLKGAESVLDSTVLGIRLETYFLPVYIGAPLFGDIHNFLKEHKFELINLNYDGRGHALSKFTLPNKYGQLIGCETVWIRDPEIIFKQNSTKIAENVVLLGLFLMNNNATDIAIYLMQRAKDQKKVKFDGFKNDPLFKKLKEKIAFLFKYMLSLPSTNKNEVYSTYKNLFDEEFPKSNKFYEKFSG